VIADTQGREQQHTAMRCDIAHKKGEGMDERGSQSQPGWTGLD